MYKKNDPAIIKKMILKKERETSPGPVDLYNLGNLYREIHDYDSAVKKYKLSIRAFDSSGSDASDFYKALVVKGHIYLYLSETDYRSDKQAYLEKSSVFLKTAIELKPETDLWVKLGDCYLASGKCNEALYCYGHVPEKEKRINHIYARLQAVIFQADYQKLLDDFSWQKMKNLPVMQLTDFENIQTAINNSAGAEKEIYKLQHYVYLLRLLLLKNEAFCSEKSSGACISTDIHTVEEKTVLKEAEAFIKSRGIKILSPASYNYLMGIISCLKSDYRNALVFFEESLRVNEYPEHVYRDLLAAAGKSNDDAVIKKIIFSKISKYPDASDYLIIAGNEFKKGNLKNAEMLCTRSLKIKNYYSEAFSGLAVIYAFSGNYMAADEMIKKAGYYIQDVHAGRKMKNRLIVNGAAIALLKNEKERAYILLRLVLSADNDEKAAMLFSRFFRKDGKIQN
jgi:tetratricopeptide (TPR) repeat protein